ncbi:uncharacterized protein LOC103968999 isoform X1 [Musa acuminata AAA Group]|uniref:uncharacterized protein LOC103968999 isoform X1 n=1 Tax=Musa acuminata AAA Group TaxID=214697 RepID=UPI0031D38296
MDTCPSIKNVKYYTDDWPTLAAKSAYEKSVFTRTLKINACTEVFPSMYTACRIILETEASIIAANSLDGATSLSEQDIIFLVLLPRMVKAYWPNMQSARERERARGDGCESVVVWRRFGYGRLLGCCLGLSRDLSPADDRGLEAQAHLHQHGIGGAADQRPRRAAESQGKQPAIDRTPRATNLRERRSEKPAAAPAEPDRTTEPRRSPSSASPSSNRCFSITASDRQLQHLRQPIRDSPPFPAVRFVSGRVVRRRHRRHFSGALDREHGRFLEGGVVFQHGQV